MSPMKSEKDNIRPGHRRTPFSRGVAAAWPICLGYLPIGLAFGVLAQKAGLSPLQIGLMSVFVFAGSSQFIATMDNNEAPAANIDTAINWELPANTNTDISQI